MTPEKLKMKNRLAIALSKNKSNNQKAFVPFNVLGYPDIDKSVESLLALAAGGATCLEVGIPFSDPIADGPVIQNASHKVLETGFEFRQALNVIARIREANIVIPINVLTYYNVALSIGQSKFLKDLKGAGADGVTFVDLPIEEIDEIAPLLDKVDLLPIMLISPLTPRQRMKTILKYAKGFVYLVSKAGVTGIDENFEKSLGETLKTIKELKDIPVFIGFGIANKRTAKKMIELGADGVIVGTKILKIIEESKPIEVEDNLLEFEREILCSINS